MPLNCEGEVFENVLNGDCLKLRVMIESKAGQYGQNLYPSIFLNFVQYDVILISMSII